MGDVLDTPSGFPSPPVPFSPVFNFSEQFYGSVFIVVVGGMMLIDLQRGKVFVRGGSPN